MAWPGDLSTQVTGYLVPASDWNDIVNAINHLGDDQDHWSGQGAGHGAAIPGTLLYVTHTDVAQDGTEKTVMTMTIAQDALSTNYGIRIMAEADVGGSGVQTWKVKLDGTTILTVTNTNTGSNDTHLFWAMVRNDDNAAVQVAVGGCLTGSVGGTAQGSGTANNSTGNNTLTVTLTTTGSGNFIAGRVFGIDWTGTPS